MQEQVRRAGAVPATIGVVNGVPTVGLDDAELLLLAQPASDSKRVFKCSRRDLAFLCATRTHSLSLSCDSKSLTMYARTDQHAATTVATTSYLASLAGIAVFATGGLGGVHRGAELTMDVSADLFELSRTRTTVVCSGVKSILDIPKTLEVLESLGVPVLTYRADEFPAFFTNHSGIPAQHRVDSASEVARVMLAATRMNMANGMVVAVPNPSPASSDIQAAIELALAEARARGVSGAHITPFVLAHISSATKGTSLDANVELVLNNAALAADIASEYCSLTAQPLQVAPVPARKSIDRAVRPSEPSFVCIGGAVVDLIGSPANKLLDVRGKSVPGSVSKSFGGVARNVAEAIARQHCSVSLVSVVGADGNGAELLQHAALAGVDTSLVRSAAGARTASYLAVTDGSGTVVSGIADMSIFEELIDDALVDSLAAEVKRANAVFCDGNVSVKAFKRLASQCAEAGTPLVFDCTSDTKSVLPLRAHCLSAVALLKTNESELRCILRHALTLDYDARVAGALDSEDGGYMGSILGLAVELQRLMRAPYRGVAVGARTVVVTMAEKGVLCVGASGSLGSSAVPVKDGVSVLILPSLPIAADTIVSTSGAGDCLLSAVLVGYGQGRTLHEALERGLHAARDSILSPLPVPRSFSSHLKLF